MVISLLLYVRYPSGHSLVYISTTLVDKSYALANLCLILTSVKYTILIYAIILIMKLWHFHVKPLLSIYRQYLGKDSLKIYIKIESQYAKENVCNY